MWIVKIRNSGGRRRPNDIVGDVSASRTVTVPSGSGSISGSLSLPQDCLCSSAYATGHGSGNC